MSIRIIVDSASDITKNEAENLNVIMVPIEIRFKDETFYDGVDLTANLFYEKLVESADLPTTSQINPYRFKQIFKEIVDNGDEAIVITISSKLSGTYSNAVQAAMEFNGKIAVIDSLNACVGERLLLLYALRLINENKTLAEITRELNEKKHKICVLAMLDTLEYLKKGGRISPLVAFSGKLLMIKPVISVVKGEIKLVGKAHGSKNGSNLLNKLVEEKNGIDFTMPYSAVYSGFDDTMLKKYVLDSSKLWEGSTKEIPSYIIGSTVGTHIGPGAIGVAFFEK